MAALRLNQSSEMGISLPIPDTIEALMEDKKPIPKSFAPKTSPVSAHRTRMTKM